MLHFLALWLFAASCLYWFPGFLALWLFWLWGFLILTLTGSYTVQAKKPVGFYVICCPIAETLFWERERKKIPHIRLYHWYQTVYAAPVTHIISPFYLLRPSSVIDFCKNIMSKILWAIIKSWCFFFLSLSYIDLLWQSRKIRE